MAFYQKIFGYYKQNGELKIVKEKFVENFIRGMIFMPRSFLK